MRRVVRAAKDGLGVFDGPYEPGYLERLRAGGFALATARAQRADVASFDRRVRRALPKVGLKLTGHLR